LNPEDEETNLDITVEVEVRWEEVSEEIVVQTPNNRSGQTNVEQNLSGLEKNFLMLRKNLLMLRKNLNRSLRRNLLKELRKASFLQSCKLLRQLGYGT